MTAIGLRLLLFVVIGIAIYLGVSRIWRDWTRQFRTEETQSRDRRRARDLAERQRTDVIDLKRSDDGIFRPGDDDGSNNQR